MKVREALIIVSFSRNNIPKTTSKLKTENLVYLTSVRSKQLSFRNLPYFS